MKFEHRKCLVLNRNWRPIGTVSLEDAICKVFSTYPDGKHKATIIEPTTYQSYSWDEWSAIEPGENDDCITSSNARFRVPEIILLSKYEKLPTPRLNFSRRTLYRRDKFTCQYCGDSPGDKNMSIDHVVPRAKGGRTTWENCVASCLHCNRKKADKTLKESGMKLLREPKKPDLEQFRFDAAAVIPSWEPFIVKC